MNAHLREAKKGNPKERNKKTRKKTHFNTIGRRKKINEKVGIDCIVRKEEKKKKQTFDWRINPNRFDDN